MISYLQFPFARKANYEIGGRREGKRDWGGRGEAWCRCRAKKEEEGAKEDEDKRGTWLLKVKIFY